MPRRLGPLLFAVILVASVIAAGIALSARGPELALEVGRLHRLEPGSAGPKRVTRIRFFVRESDSAAKVSIVGPGQELTRTLSASVALKAGTRVSYRWNGLTDNGEPAPSGDYHLRVVLPHNDRSMVYPLPIKLRR